MNDDTDDAEENAEDDGDRYLALSAEDLSASALRGLIEEFVSRDGTDYGRSEASLDQKVVGVERQLERGDVLIIFDRETDTTNLVLAREWDQSDEATIRRADV